MTGDAVSVPKAPDATAQWTGLSDREAAARLAEGGPNLVGAEEERSPWRLALDQLRSPLVGLLLAASAATALLGEAPEAIAIAAIVVLNALVGLLQEHRADRALRALRRLSAPRAVVVRDGRRRVVPAEEVVPGDLLALEAGDVVAADGRLIESHDLCIDEAVLTGESAPARKTVEASPADAPLADRRDRVHLGTSVVRGTALARVEAIGMATEMGRVASLLATVERSRTPLQTRLGQVTRTLVLVCLGIVAVTASISLSRGEPVLAVLMLAVSLAVAAVPEGLAAIVTVALAVGVHRMARHNVLVRRLAAIETLGSTTVICTDKTGTLTTGQMAVREIRGPEEAVLRAAAACCDADLDAGVGDPTELAILRAAAERGIHRRDIERETPRRAVEPFDPVTRRMSVLRADGTRYHKGAPEVIGPLCGAGRTTLEAADGLAERGLRVLAVARQAEGSHPRFLGLVGLADPPRASVKEAVAVARSAGVRTVMITGDNAGTAVAIAREVGLLTPAEDPAGIVYARATPEDKIRVVAECKGRGEVVAMTGDGVNDAPSLRAAHVGIAMGRAGTEVTREAADVVLTDDDYPSIVAGIREGRGIWDNIQKALTYLLAGNAGELLIVTGALLAQLTPPLLPLTLLWINLVTDGLPALALVTDPPDPKVMLRSPRPLGHPTLGAREWLRIGLVGALDAAVVLAAFLWALRDHDVDVARTVALCTLVSCQMLRAFSARSPTLLFWEVGPFTNARLPLVIVATGLLQVGLVAWAPSRELFGLGATNAALLLWSFGLGLVPVTAVETAKLVRRWRVPPGRCS